MERGDEFHAINIHKSVFIRNIHKRTNCRGAGIGYIRGVISVNSRKV